jgi:hypothetical protein
MTLSITTLSITVLSAIILSVVMLSVVMLSVTVLSVVAPVKLPIKFHVKVLTGTLTLFHFRN